MRLEKCQKMVSIFYEGGTKYDRKTGIYDDRPDGRRKFAGEGNEG